MKRKNTKHRLVPLETLYPNRPPKQQTTRKIHFQNPGVSSEIPEKTEENNSVRYLQAKKIHQNILSLSTPLKEIEDDTKFIVNTMNYALQVPKAINITFNRIHGRLYDIQREIEEFSTDNLDKHAVTIQSKFRSFSSKQHYNVILNAVHNTIRRDCSAIHESLLGFFLAYSKRDDHFRVLLNRHFVNQSRNALKHWRDWSIESHEATNKIKHDVLLMQRSWLDQHCKVFKMLTHKTQLLHTRRGNVIRLSREHYLREDIDCRLPNFSENPFTTPDAEYVLVLSSETILNQMDALQDDNMKNILFLQTIYETVRTKSRATINRLDRLIRTPEKHFSVFANEHYKKTYVEQTESMTTQEHHQLLILKALEFLSSIFPIIYLTNTEKDYEEMKLISGDSTPFTIDTIHHWADNNESLANRLTAPDAINADEIQYEDHLSALEVHKLVDQGNAFVGTFSLSQFSREEATVRTQKNGEIIIQNKLNQNRAIEGDMVAVQLLPEEKFLVVGDTKFPTGKVIAIMKPASRIICGTIQQPPTVTNDWQNVLVVPHEPSLPKIRIRTRIVNQLLGCRVQVAIDGWAKNSRYPNGHYIATIGTSGDIQTESEVILLTHQIPHNSFPPAVIECLPPADYQPTEEEISNRRDLRDRCVVSIDPPGCVDIDDALHFKDISDTECEVGIHIADVSYFVREGTAIDLEARERGTTVYLTEKRINMLPSLLSENLCSLMGGIERFAFSVVAILDKRTAETKDIWFGRTIILNRDSMSYQKAQQLVEDENDHSEIAEGIRQLLYLSRIMKQKRFDAGALKLSSPQLHFVLDSETHEPLRGELYEHLEVNSLVEEFMLYANIEVAKRIYQVFPQSAMLRRHEPPLAARFDFLNRALKRFHLHIDPESNKTLTETLDNVGEKEKSLDEIVRIMTTRCMQFAKYFASGTQSYDNFRHFGLAMPIYTHFTSPIRRYSDLIVHRQLAIACGYENVSNELSSKQFVEGIAENLNYRHRMAQEAGRDSAQLFMMELLRKTPGKVEEGKVIRIKPTVFVVLIEKYGVDGHIHVDGDKWRFNEDEECLCSEERVIRIFDTVRVRVNVTPMNMHGRSRLDLELVNE
ncbi:exosome complex exonuclease RRP44 [Histomonas meleagridis]|uniref:exosome complex exonuclease RRP44 n=1 Tax=Histomonas meleagridis TaxID=135588 RepID=UPI0035594D73|nr:exosome complex exonuclease RRP44 [Histomonas meleagridis]KAH0801161.1 exosome complex exonuclease RRP44 [Histomonas meleagridis]